MLHIPEEVVKRVIEEKEKNSKTSSERIANKISKIFSCDLIGEDVKEIIALYRKNKDGLKETSKILSDIKAKEEEKSDGGLKELSLSDDKPLKYDVSDRHYIFYKDNQPYKVLISTVRNIWSDYSKNGGNLSGEDIRLKYKLPAGIFELIKSSTGLYKSSHVDDPVTLSRLSHEGLEDYIEDSVEKNLEDKYISIYDKAVKNKVKRDIDKFAKSKSGYNLFIEKFMEALVNYKPIDFSKIKIPEIENNMNRDVFITDSHFGKEGTDWIVKRFHTLTTDLLSTPEKYITLTFGGDLGECFLPYGEMHPGQKLGMEDMPTHDLIMFIIDIFENMLLTLYKAGKIVTFNGMKGNHDRMTEKKEFDPHRTPALIIYKFLEKILQDTSIKINILNDRANIIRSGNIKYIFIHGDGLSERELQRRALAEVEEGYYLVIVSGDKHHFRMVEISDRVLWIQSPAMAGKGKYDESLAMSSLPGSLEFIKNNSNTIDFIVKRYR